MTDAVLELADRTAFRAWLVTHAPDGDGVWLLFGKKGGPRTLSAKEALEEALCFGWIDGQMQSLDDTRYKKYFARRTAASVWSEKNAKLAQSLVDQGRMTRQGAEAIEAAQAAGVWGVPPGRAGIGDEQVQELRLLVQPHEVAYANLLAMSPSVQKTYAGFYLDAKSEVTRRTRLEKIVDRLGKNLKPM